MLTCKGRIFVIKVIFVSIFFIVIYRLYSIQILDKYKFYNKYHRYKNKKIVIPADRGIIYDCNGISFVENKKIFKLELCPNNTRWTNTDSVRQLADEKQKIHNLISIIIAKHTGKPSDIFIKRIENFAPKYQNGFELVKNLDVVSKNNILSELEKNQIIGITCFKQPSIRIYQQGDLACPLIGYYTNENGICGIEQTFNKELTGIDGWAEVIQYGTGWHYHFPDMDIKKPVRGNSVYLSIDAHIQSILEKNLKDGLRNYNAKNAIGIIISPKNGDILAMSGISEDYLVASIRIKHSIPIFPINWLFEPGSTLKPITALLAIEKDLFKSSDIIDCYTRQVGRRIISDVKPFNELTFKEVIAYSSNVGITRIVDELSKIDLYNRLIELGFGNKTGITLDGESLGILRKPSKWSKYSLHSLSFGQEISVTPLQLVFAFGALVNGGEVLQPQIIKKIVSDEGDVLFKSKKKIVRQISDTNALDTLKTFLKAVVDDGIGSTTSLDYVNIAGKTGTAEKKKIDGFGYDEDKFVSSFIGFFPVEAPQILMLIIFDEPDYDHRFGSICAAPTFKKIAEEIIVLPNSNLINVINKVNQDYILVPDCIGVKVSELKEFLLSKNIVYSIFGNGEFVTNQFPKPGTSMLEEFSIMIIAEDKLEEEFVQHYLKQ
ncbi:MAG: hypothetical protein KAW87_03185 [Candidatus Cloacimonetes bacterium]|nr:hypothetical protein [Candidatus Cloacimonadota bacterium]